MSFFVRVRYFFCVATQPWSNVDDIHDKKKKKYLHRKKKVVILQPQFDKSWNVLETL